LGPYEFVVASNVVNTCSFDNARRARNRALGAELWREIYSVDAERKAREGAGAGWQNM
jgi:hypothetical protein